MWTQRPSEDGTGLDGMVQDKENRRNNNKLRIIEYPQWQQPHYGRMRQTQIRVVVGHGIGFLCFLLCPRTRQRENRANLTSIYRHGAKENSWDRKTKNTPWIARQMGKQG